MLYLLCLTLCTCSVLLTTSSIHSNGLWMLTTKLIDANDHANKRITLAYIATSSIVYIEHIPSI